MILTVSEYARVKGITVQAVYQQLEKNQITGTYRQNGKKKTKCVNVELSPAEQAVLKQFKTNVLNQEKTQNISNKDNFNNTGFKAVSNQSFKPNEESFKPSSAEPTETHENSEISALKAQIETLNKQIIEKDRLIAEYADKFAVLAAQAQQIADKALTAGQQKYLPENKPKKSFWHKVFNYFEEY